jgi:hypothetical protein
MGVRGATKAGRYGILRRWGAEKYLGFCVWGLACSTFPLRAETGAVLFGRDEKTVLAIRFVVMVLLGAV